MTVLYITAEVSPFSKAGGLADVSGALPAELARFGEHMIVITPLYSLIDCQQYGIYPTGIQGEVLMGNTPRTYHIYESHYRKNSDHRIYFIENDHYFRRSGIYTHPNGKGFEDNTERYFFFQLSIIDMLKRGVFHPQLIHCHDHHSALIPMMIHEMGYPAPILYTIHNFDYRGYFSDSERSLLPEGISDIIGQMESTGHSTTSLALTYSDWVNTVSPTYAGELLARADLSDELHGKLNSIRQKFSGILNGADDTYWNPMTDPHLTHHYSIDDLSGKIKNKLKLQRACELPVGAAAPVAGSIGRLVESKGYSLILASLEDLIREGMQFVFLGSGNETIAGELTRLSQQYPAALSFHQAIDEKLAHLIEAGSDMFIMPSEFEPCGLNQIYSMKYGTIPVVHRTGGLADTVTDWDGSFGTGFVFEPYSTGAFLGTMRRALEVFTDPDTWYKIQMNAMSRDFSWKASASVYQKLYHQLAGAGIHG